MFGKIGRMSWKWWGVLCLALIAAAEARNIADPDELVSQWALFLAGVACFGMALRDFDRRR